jgi:hypothetical protein
MNRSLVRVMIGVGLVSGLVSSESLGWVDLVLARVWSMCP